MAGHPESFQNIPLHPSAIPFHLPSPVLPRVRTQEPTTASLPAPHARPAHLPAPANRRRCCDDWQARPAPPPASLWPAASRPVAPLSVARAGRVDTIVSRALAAGHSSARRSSAPRRPAWTSRTVSGARGGPKRRRRRAGGRAAGGLRRGSVYRLKMAVWLCSVGRGPGSEPWGPGAARGGAAGPGPRCLGGRPRPRPPATSRPRRAATGPTGPTGPSG